MEHTTREALALLILRVGCAWFIFVWAVNKFLAGPQYQQLMKAIDKVDVGLTTVYIIAGIQVVVCLLVFVGWARVVSYGALFLMHAFTVYRQWPQFIDPFAVNEHGFPVNRNVVISLTALAAMAALWLLRHRDHWSLDVVLRKARDSAN